MKPPRFRYARPDTLEQALDLLAGSEDARVLAGGQSLLPMLNFRLLGPQLLVDINRIATLTGLEIHDQDLRIGALTRHHVLETSPVVAERLPLLAAAMKHVAHLAIRNRGTIGGSISHADPAAELPLMLLMHDGRVTLASQSGERVVQARDFFLGALMSDVSEGEIVTRIDLPIPAAGHGWAFEEVARRAGDFALAAVAVILTVADGRAQEVRIGAMGVGETALRLSQAEARLQGQALDDALLDTVVAAVRAQVQPDTDLHASADYRRHLVGVLAKRAVRDAWQRAQGLPQISSQGSN
jgi:CO/xanthine dehydrogenase FAD-binding subunit